MDAETLDKYLVCRFSCFQNRTMVGPDLVKEYLLKEYERVNNLPITDWTNQELLDRLDTKEYAVYMLHLWTKVW